MRIEPGHPLRCNSLTDVESALVAEISANKDIAGDGALNTETRHVALGRLNLAEQMLIRLGRTIDVTGHNS